MKRMLKIMIYCIGIGLVVGVGVYAELNSGRYPHLQNKEGAISVRDVLPQQRSHRN